MYSLCAMHFPTMYTTLCRSGHVEAVKELLAASAKIEVQNKRSVTPLGEAIVSGHLMTAKTLVAAGGNAGAPHEVAFHRLAT